ncbi:hypothetical protein [Mucilaginibacter lacusdianchii]|uniref:hypothetical protein n=1 Tax=Mucilaginibacter lacusdianchii TaxID=2684211 RepID=UPI00131E4DF7|nr:hypothetical protein [Mucilaginibacter sp. JXJ CY 39]
MLYKLSGHITDAVYQNREIKVGGAGAGISLVGAGISHLNINTVIEHIGQAATVIGFFVALLALLRGIYSFRKEIIADRKQRQNEVSGATGSSTAYNKSGTS